MACCSLESDGISFHPDDSGRIIHVGPTIIKWVTCTVIVMKHTEDNLIETGARAVYSLHHVVTTAKKACRCSVIFVSSVLKIHGELNIDLPANIMNDYTIATNRNLTVSNLPFLHTHLILQRCCTCSHGNISLVKNVYFPLSLRGSQHHRWLSPHQAALWKKDSISWMTIQIKR